MTKRKPVVLDPAVNTILGESTQRQQQRTMTAAQRQRAQRQATSKGVNYLMNIELADIIRRLADSLGISPASAVNRLLLDALQRYAAGELTFDEYLQPSRSSRYQWIIEINPNGLSTAVAQQFAKTDGEN